MLTKFTKRRDSGQGADRCQSRCQRRGRGRQNSVDLRGKKWPHGDCQGADRCQSRCQREGGLRLHPVDLGSREWPHRACQGADRCQSRCRVEGPTQHRVDLGGEEWPHGGCQGADPCQSRCHREGEGNRLQPGVLGEAELPQDCRADSQGQEVPRLPKAI